MISRNQSSMLKINGKLEPICHIWDMLYTRQFDLPSTYIVFIVIHQTQKTVFNHIDKQREES